MAARTGSRSATALLLIRHGEAQPDSEGLGRTSPLSERGRLQAAALAQEIAGKTPLAAVYASGLPRAVQTAEPLARALGLVASVDERVAEFELGTKPVAVIRERPDLALWRPEHRAADGETLAAFGARVAHFLDEIVARHADGTVAVVCHSGVIDAALRWAFGIPPAEPWQFELEVLHASITEVEVWPNGRAEGGAPRYAVLRRLNHVAHLGALASDI